MLKREEMSPSTELAPGNICLALGEQYAIENRRTLNR
jgi:hypothetical protein